MTTDLLPDLVRPGDPGWDAARRGWNTSVDQRPAAVAQATSVADVQAAMRHARAAGLRVAPQATGHGSESLDLDALRGALLLRTEGLDAVAVDPVARTATVGAGVTAGALADAAGAHGLAPVLGLAASVGVAGLSLGGGLGAEPRARPGGQRRAGDRGRHGRRRGAAGRRRARARPLLGAARRWRALRDRHGAGGRAASGRAGHGGHGRLAGTSATRPRRCSACCASSASWRSWRARASSWPAPRRSPAMPTSRTSRARRAGSAG
jgi:FAD/FMN-containing dehydrogenase